MFGYNTIRSFSKVDWNHYQDEMYQSIDKELSRNDDDYILNVCEEQYISYLTEKYTLAASPSIPRRLSAFSAVIAFFMESFR